MQRSGFPLAVAWTMLAQSFPSYPAQSPHPTPHAAVWSNSRSDSQPALARQVADDIQTAGYAVTFIDNDALVDGASLNADRVQLLLLPEAPSLPLDAIGPLETFLRAGGSLIALGAPLWKNPLFRHGDRWFTQTDFDQELAAVKPDHSLAALSRDNLARWERASNAPDSKARRESEPVGGGSALHVTIENLSGWDTLASPPLDHPFPTGHTLTCFRAKGGPHTSQLAVEWRETDGSRWIASVDLASTWQSYVLTPERFQPWEPPRGRGGRGDRLRVENAVQFTVGLAFSHTAVPPGQHEYWLADLGTAPNPFGDFTPPSTLNLPRLETLSPAYQCYPVTGPVELRAPDGLAIGRRSIDDSFVRSPGFSRSVPVEPPEGGTPNGTRSSSIAAEPLTNEQVAFSQPASRVERGDTHVTADSQSAGETAHSLPEPLNALQPRPRGVGFAQHRPWRWQPLLDAWSGNGDYRGAVATLLVHAQPPYRGGVWASFTPSTPEFYRQAAIRQVLRELAACLRRGVFLLEGGSEFFTVFDDQPCRLGARVANFGRENQTNLVVRVAVSERANGQIAFAREWKLDPATGGEQTVEQTWQPPHRPAGGFRVTTELLTNGLVIDRLQHELNFWQPKVKPEFVEARDGRLWLRGKPWKAHGVNYMPSSGIGVVGEYFEYWLDRGAYDPEVIERDLERVKAMGLNAVSVFVYHRELKAQHLLDFLQRCDTLGLHVNQSLRPGTPLEFRWDEMKELIEFFRLPQNDTVFAYDLAWEPSHYDHAHQQTHYAAAWDEWVRRRYGSIAAAEKAWGVAAPRADSRPDRGSDSGGPNEVSAVPPMSQLTHDGPWRKLVADYRAFLDELLRDKYAEARRLVKSIDPHHAVSFRMQLAGDPTFNSEGLLPYDFYGLSDAVDLWEPEAYGRIGDWNKVKAGEFTAAYARLCDPKKPLVWAEMGYNVWDLSRMAPHPDKLAFAEGYYRDFYRMLRESGADGVFFWWYPGGYRVNEQSDFGIINPDGTDRAITRVIRAEALRFLDAPKPPSPNSPIKIDRDRDARGLFGVHEKVQGEFWRAVGEGKTPGLAWERRPGDK